MHISELMRAISNQFISVKDIVEPNESLTERTWRDLLETKLFGIGEEPATSRRWWPRGMNGIGSKGKVAIDDSPELRGMRRERLVDGDGAFVWDTAASNLWAMEVEEPA